MKESLMEFTVKQKDLLKELKLLAGVVETATTIPILSSVLIEASGDSLVMTGSDLETSLRCTCPAVVKTPGAGTVPAKLLLNYVRLLPDSDIRFKLLDNFWMSLQCARSKAKIAGMSRESYPAIPNAGESLTEIPIGQFSSMIGRVDFAISKEESRFTLAGALLVLKGDSIVMVATDGHRLAYVEVKREAGHVDKRIIMPRKAMSQVLRLAAEEEAATPVHISRDEHSLFFRLGNRVLICRELSGSFPDYARVLPKDALPNQVVLEREPLQAAISRVASFSDERSHSIRLSFGKAEVKLDSSSVEIGESEEGIGVDYAGAAVQVALKSDYLLDFLKATSESQVVINFTDGKGALELRPGGEKQEYRYIVMPMRI